MRYLIIVLLLLTACGQTDYQNQGQDTVRDLVRILAKVRTREQLEGQVPKLRDRFEALVDTMIEASEAGYEPPKRSFQYSERLREELIRIYEIEGAREVIELAQREALQRLDDHEKKFRDRSGAPK